MRYLLIRYVIRDVSLTSYPIFYLLEETTNFCFYYWYIILHCVNRLEKSERKLDVSIVPIILIVESGFCFRRVKVLVEGSKNVLSTHG